MKCSRKWHFLENKECLFNTGRKISGHQRNVYLWALSLGILLSHIFQWSEDFEAVDCLLKREAQKTWWLSESTSSWKEEDSWSFGSISLCSPWQWPSPNIPSLHESSCKIIRCPLCSLFLVRMPVSTTGIPWLSVTWMAYTMGYLVQSRP